MARIVNLPKPTEFDWDKGNKEKNWKKHKVKFKECEEVFFNKPLKVFYGRQRPQNEERLVAYGKTNRNRKLVIVFTFRNSKIRVISARNQSKKERRLYGQK